jgi:hypothetical protein
MDKRLPKTLLKNVDLPTLGLPTTATMGLLICIFPFFFIIPCLQHTYYNNRFLPGQQLISKK